MKVLITGAGGFIGSHLTEKCVQLGYDVRAFVHYNANNSWGWLDESKYKNQIEVIAGDIRDYDSVFSAMHGIDTVLHLAALIGIPYSYISPIAYIRTNIEGTYNILQSAKVCETKNILITSTSETYGTAQYVPIDEKHPLVGQSPYSATKISADQLSISFYRSFNMPIKIIRPFNTYGPRQSARAVIPTIISQILKGKKKIKLGDLTPTRDFNFVKDTALGFIEIYKSKKLWGEVTNIGTNKDISIGDLVNKIIKLTNQEVEIIEDHNRIRPKNSEVQRLLCDNTKIKKYTDWEPQYALDQGLEETIAWISSNSDKFKEKIYNV